MYSPALWKEAIPSIKGVNERVDSSPLTFHQCQVTAVLLGQPPSSYQGTRRLDFGAYLPEKEVHSSAPAEKENLIYTI